MNSTKIGIDEYDVVNQRLVSHHYRVEGGKLHVLSMSFRYVWPSELDPHSPYRRHETARTLERLGSFTFHERQSEARLGVGKDRVKSHAALSVAAQSGATKMQNGCPAGSA